MSIKPPKAVDDEMHAMAAAMGVRLHRAGERRAAAAEPGRRASSVFVKWESASGIASLPVDNTKAPIVEQLCGGPAEGIPVHAIDEEVREAAKQLDSRLALQRAQIAALEAKAADFWRNFGVLSAQIDGLMSPPPARRPGVKPAISGLTCTAAEDHRLGRFKG